MRTMVKGFCGAFLALALMFALAAPAAAQDASAALAEAKRLNAEVVRLYGEGKYAEATERATRALALSERTLPAGHPEIATSLNNLALLYKAQGRLAEAEPLLKRALALHEQALPEGHPDIATSLNNLAFLYNAQGRLAEAEPLFKRALALRERALPAGHPAIATSLNNLAALYNAQGRLAEAEPLFKRALALHEQALPEGHPDIAQSLNNLALLYQDQGRLAEAEPLHKRALALREQALPEGHPDIARSLNNLASLYKAQGRLAEAEPLHKRALALYEQALPEGHPDIATSLNNLASLYKAQGRLAEAEPLFKRALALFEQALPADHPNIALSLNNLAVLAVAQANLAGAAEAWQRATAQLQVRAARGLASAAAGSTKSETQQFARFFSGLVKTTQRLAAAGRRPEATAAAEMFETAQWGQSSEAAAALAQMAARSAGGSPELAALVRDRQDLIVEWQVKDKRLIAAKSQPQEKRNAAAETELSERLAAIDTRLAEIDQRLAKDFPDYAALASPKPISVVEAQASLHDDEALVLFLDTDNRFPNLPEETFVWVVTKSDVRWLRSDLGTAALNREVAALRCGLDRTAWYGEGALTCADLLKLPRDKAPGETNPLPFDAARAHALYQSLLGGAADLIRGKHLLVVPSGALTKLPFQVLVTQTPDPTTPLNSIRWLARDHALTVLPSVASLKALRRDARPSRAGRPMIGFGNPLLNGDQDHPQHGAWYKERAQLARETDACRPTTYERVASRLGWRGGVSPVATRGGIADLAHLKRQKPLPETADELCAVARDLGADVREMRLGTNATETEIKRLSATGDLARYRIVHFATHGTLAGQLSGTSEPGLILTPPDTATPENDGYLSGSEIASLKLDADWVILSACNTAGGADDTNAEALGGLARVFFYAGARALLVSHWEVDSDATVELITIAVREISDGSVGRAEALRRAMLAMIDGGSAREAHPAYWAPFVVVGEGAAAGRQ